ncbi:hypothetical protein GGX14DRAFT_563667 [Mycena pura]|uniref:Uncharacterized protein n=1 Tax=Mycena pura TaxID=153505 RepID=A0AAD6YHL8_9AGAR|nr:hypothetical protein GGX14DRAFT_563667 [Mycena pura]
MQEGNTASGLFTTSISSILIDLGASQTFGIVPPAVQASINLATWGRYHQHHLNDLHPDWHRGIPREFYDKIIVTVEEQRALGVIPEGFVPFPLPRAPDGTQLTTIERPSTPPPSATTRKRVNTRRASGGKTSRALPTRTPRFPTTPTQATVVSFGTLSKDAQDVARALCTSPAPSARRTHPKPMHATHALCTPPAPCKPPPSSACHRRALHATAALCMPRARCTRPRRLPPTRAVHVTYAVCVAHTVCPPPVPCTPSVRRAHPLHAAPLCTPPARCTSPAPSAHAVHVTPTMCMHHAPSARCTLSAPPPPSARCACALHVAHAVCTPNRTRLAHPLPPVPSRVTPRPPCAGHYVNFYAW